MTPRTTVAASGGTTKTGVLLTEEQIAILALKAERHPDLMNLPIWPGQ